MKAFRFQQFDIRQSKDVFRVGTDAVLLGALADVSHSKQILEVGTGTGIISLMLAQRNPHAHFTAIDINPEAVILSEENFSASPFSGRMHVECVDFKTMKPDKKYDFIVCNPPYFEINTSSKDVLARQRLELDFSDLIKKSSELLSVDGLFSVIIPISYETEFTGICHENSLFLNRKVIIKGIKTADAKRVILEYSFNDKEAKIENFVIEKSPRVYSDEYLALTKDFHIFNKKPL